MSTEPVGAGKTGSGANASEPKEVSTPQSTAVTRAGLMTRLRNNVVLWLKGAPAGFDDTSSNGLAEARTDLAVTRTLMAADRTLMAWIRTALSLMSFGFTIYKVLEGFQRTGGLLPDESSPRNIGLFLTAMGTVAMVMGTIEYWQSLKLLRQMQYFRLARPPLIMALLMSVTGVFLFFSIITRLF